MDRELNELQKLKGVGEVLSRRLVEAGLDTPAKVAAAGEDGLRGIPGLNPHLIPSIVTQAAEMADEAGKGRAVKVEELRQRVNALKEGVQAIALDARDRFGEEIAGKAGRKAEKLILKLIASLEKVEGKLESRVKSAGKGVTKAEKRLAPLADADLAGVGKGLKKARKSLKRVYA